MEAHTPGPWAINEEDGPVLYDGMLRPVWLIHGGDGTDSRLVGSVEHFKEDDCPNANALLISAAPELLEALQLAEDVLSRAPFSNQFWPGDMHPNRGITLIRAALAKATGA